MRSKIVLHIVLCFICSLAEGRAQTIDAKETVKAVQATNSTIQRSSSIENLTPEDSIIRRAELVADSITSYSSSAVEPFKPNPRTAVLRGLVPGLGQVYNRKYWKLPIVYGGFMACAYAITWNNGNYADYSSAYVDILADAERPDEPDTWSQNWQDLLPYGVDPANYVNDQNFHDTLQRRKDYYRRYRDLSIIITVGIYALSLVDAYVDAHLFDFDISDDLSLNIAPDVQLPTGLNKSTYGFNCSLRF